MGTIKDKKKAGNCQLTIWENTGPHGAFNSYQLQRVYKEAEEFKFTDNLNETDLGDAIALLSQAQTIYRVKTINTQK